MMESISLYSYRFGQFELQPSERRLLAAGVPVAVEPRAFDVLVTLVERAGHLVTKEELFSLVWPKLIVEDTNLHVQVSALRKILGPVAIATVPGQGYRFTLELTRAVIDSAPLVAVAKSGLPGATFTGSGRELADVKALLADTRLLTLIGTDATGKTRLLLQVAADLMGNYPDGVWFVDLAPLLNGRQVSQAVVAVLGVEDAAERPVIEVLSQHVKDRRLLLILDNCDHVPHACTELAKQLLQSSLHLKLLVSCREQLHLAGELIYPVPALPNTVPPIRAFGAAHGTMPNVHEQPVRRYPLPRLRRWPWLAGVAVLLIASLGALLWETETKPVTTPATNPPTLSIAILPFATTTDVQLAELLLPEITDAFRRDARVARIASPGQVASYKGKQFDTRAIGHDINVRYVAEGEIRRVDDMRLLSARLIDTTNGSEVWSERFDVPDAEPPARRGAFATRVAVHIWLALLNAESDRAAHQAPSSSTATDFWLRGVAVDDDSLDNALAARKLYEKALQLDPRLVGAMVDLGVTYGTELDLSAPADGDRLRRALDELSLRAVATDRTDPRVWYLRSYAQQYNGRWEESLESIAELQRIEPYRITAFVQRANALIALGRSDEALTQVDQGLELDPSGLAGANLLRKKCQALSYLGKYEQAIAACAKAASLHEMMSPYFFLTADYAQVGQMDKAAAAKTRLLELKPRVSIARYEGNVSGNPVWARQAEANVIPGLRKAGVPEK